MAKHETGRPKHLKAVAVVARRGYDGVAPSRHGAGAQAPSRGAGLVREEAAD